MVKSFISYAYYTISRQSAANLCYNSQKKNIIAMAVAAALTAGVAFRETKVVIYFDAED